MTPLFKALWFTWGVFPLTLLIIRSFPAASLLGKVGMGATISAWWLAGVGMWLDRKWARILAVVTLLSLWGYVVTRIPRLVGDVQFGENGEDNVGFILIEVVVEVVFLLLPLSGMLLLILCGALKPRPKPAPAAQPVEVSGTGNES